MSSEIFKRAHTHADTDMSKDSLHHTLGSGPNQAAPGSLVGKVEELEQELAALRALLEN